MILLFVAAMAAEPAPAPEVWYHQAVACAASAAVDRKKKGGSDASDTELLTWGLVMADAGKKVGRTPEQIDTADVAAAEQFYDSMSRARPKAFEAHRLYCRSLTP